MGNIIVFCAHDDDLAVGAMGTILKHIENGDNVLEVIFSTGEGSHPHVQEKIITRKRSNETLAINEKIGLETLFLGLQDGKLKSLITKEIKEKIREVLQTYKPYKIFINSEKDPHPDHRSVFHTILDLLKYSNLDCNVYTYEVWNLFGEDKPSVYIDITKQFKEKVKIMKQYKSQKHFIYPLIIPVYLRARAYGKKINVKYAEKFYKIK